MTYEFQTVNTSSIIILLYAEAMTLKRNFGEHDVHYDVITFYRTCSQFLHGTLVHVV